MEVEQNLGELIDNDPLRMYVDEPMRLTAATNMIVFAVEMYKASFLHNNLDRYVKFLTMTNEERIPVLLELMNQNLTNSFVICTVFENYMKAILLYKNIVVHEFLSTVEDEDKKKVRKKQQEQPMHLIDPEKINLSTILHPQMTIGFSTLMSPKYMAKIELPANLVDFLNHLKVPRNKLHFQTSLTYTTSKSFIEKLISMDEFICVDMVNLIKKVMAVQPEAGQQPMA